MTFIVEDGTGLATANAYIDASGADLYFTDHGAPVAWTGSAGVKEEAIRIATQYIDSTYSWLGRRILQTQKLDWPRLGVIDFDGYTLDSDEVPQAVKDATSEMALRHLQLATGIILIPDESTPGSITFERVRVGTIEEELHYSGGRSQVVQYRLVDLLLRELSVSANRIIRS